MSRILEPSAVLCATAALLAASPCNGTEFSEEDMAFFEKRIRPVLVEHCYECHSEKADAAKGELLLDTREAILRGGESGSAVVPGHIEESLLIEAIGYHSLEMPPDTKLPDRVVADFKEWVRRGAPDPREGDAPPLQREKIDWDEARKFWSFKKPERHRAPKVKAKSWPQRKIDSFVLARLETAGMKPNAPAEPHTLIRRMNFDLTGLPPTPGEVDVFVAAWNRDPDRAVTQLVDRLLESPHYGERWARMWMDVMRYGEDQAHIVGQNKSLFYPNAWRYRDWLITAFNDDLPYNEFIHQQLAADILNPDDPKSHVALGFVGLGPKYYRRTDPAVMAEELEDRVDTLGRGLLGLTVSCARCHDHKFDPVSIEDYYAIAGVFASTEMFNRPLGGKAEKKDDGQAKNPEESLHIIRDLEEPVDLPVHIRGDVNTHGEIVPRRFLQVIAGDDARTFSKGSGRLELAEAITSDTNPLTARVYVNRIWARVFGRPIVGTASNFGTLGEKPSHPKLLDDLAVRFVENGWSTKWLLRELLLSSTYLQDSRRDEAKYTADPGNKLLWRMNRRRLDIESWRDAVLAGSGALDQSIGGASFEVSDTEATRRTLYGRVSRFQLEPVLALFDFPDPNMHSPGRSETTTPLQKLYVMNNPFVVERAGTLADRLLAMDATDDVTRIREAYRLLFARPANETEISQAIEFLATDSKETWRQYAQVLLASNEMLYLD